MPCNLSRPRGVHILGSDTARISRPRISTLVLIKVCGHASAKLVLAPNSVQPGRPAYFGLQPTRGGSRAGAAEREGSVSAVWRDANDNPLALQTAIVRFESDAPERKGVAVDLIGAVHVGERTITRP